MGSKHTNHHAKLKKLSEFADISVLILLVIFFLGFLAFDYEIFGLHEQIITIPHEMEVYFEFVPWIIFIVLVFDLFLKYLIVEKNLKIFFQHYWLDVVMAALILILLPLKFMKMTVSPADRRLNHIVELCEERYVNTFLLGTKQKTDKSWYLILLAYRKLIL